MICGVMTSRGGTATRKTFARPTCEKSEYSLSFGTRRASSLLTTVFTSANRTVASPSMTNRMCSAICDESARAVSWPCASMMSEQLKPCLDRMFFVRAVVGWVD